MYLRQTLVSAKLMSQSNVLIVEDESAISELLSMSLSQAGYNPLAVSSSLAARAVLTEHEVDLALVDWMLPGGSGLELVRTIRKDQKLRDMAIIMVTARTSEADITSGLDAGADDYITKPFSPREVQSRIRALLRRTMKADSDKPLRNGSLSLSPQSHRVAVDDVVVEMNHTEFKLLRHFLSNVDRVFSRAQLLDNVWGPGTFVEERTVDVHILRLRKALNAANLENAIETVRGAGYRMPKA
jgi:two-component system, OmpR family, phosphate regulon response regulator PhoB